MLLERQSAMKRQQKRHLAMDNAHIPQMKLSACAYEWFPDSCDPFDLAGKQGTVWWGGGGGGGGGILQLKL